MLALGANSLTYGSEEENTLRKEIAESKAKQISLKMAIEKDEQTLKELKAAVETNDRAKAESKALRDALWREELKLGRATASLEGKKANLEKQIEEMREEKSITPEVFNKCILPHLSTYDNDNTPCQILVPQIISCVDTYQNPLLNVAIRKHLKKLKLQVPGNT